VDKTRIIRTLCRREDWTNAIMYNTETCEDSILMNGEKASVGFVCFPVIDSKEPGFKWSRAWLNGNFPLDTFFRIYTYTSDEAPGPTNSFEKALKSVLNDKNPTKRAQSIFGKEISESSDFLIRTEGQYLWIMVEIGNANGFSPEISALHVQMSADHMTDYLPAIYKGDDFTYRFLSIFDSMVSDLEQRIDSISSELDKERASDEMLSYLAAWLNLEPEQDRKVLEERIQGAISEFETLYTVDGLKKTIKRLSGKEGIIIEWNSVQESEFTQEQIKRLSSAFRTNPYTLVVLLEEGTFKKRSEWEQFTETLKNYIPAGIELNVIMLSKGVHLGWHTYLGVNTELQALNEAEIGDSASIMIDTMIGGDK